ASMQQSPDPFSPGGAVAPASNLDPLLQRWGVSMIRDVVLDLDGALPAAAQTPDGRQVQAAQPLLFQIPAEQLDREDMMTAYLSRGINFGLAGSLSWREGLDAHALATTSGRTMRMPAQQALMMPSPYEIMQM